MSRALLRATLYPALRRLERWQRFAREGLTPLGRFVLALGVAAAIFGIDTRANQLYQLFVLAFVLLLFAGLSAALGTFSLRRAFSASRELPRTATVGLALDYVAELTTKRRGRYQGLSVSERLPDTLPSFSQFLDPRQGADPGDSWFDRLMGYPRWRRLVAGNTWAQGAEARPLDSFAATAAGTGSTRVRLQLRPLKRGYLRLRGFWLTRPDPLGLVRLSIFIPCAQSLLVIPRRYPAPRIQLPGRRQYQPGGWRVAAAVGESQEFIGLREYRPGDSPRLIHWPSWARSGEPQVKEFQDEFFTRHALVLDTFAQAGRGAHFEAAVSVAASLCDRLGDPDSLLDLLFVGARTYSLTGGRGLAGTGQFLEVLACAQPCTDKAFEQLRDALLGRAGALSAVVCVLLDFDRPRRELATALAQAGLAVRLLVVSETPSDRLAADWTGAPVQRIHPDRLAADLARV